MIKNEVESESSFVMGEEGRWGRNVCGVYKGCECVLGDDPSESEP